jgi:hypothetical protein
MMMSFTRCLFAAGCLLAIAPTASRAATRHMDASATSLAIDSPCARSVTVQPDTGLSDHVVVDAQADHPEETAQLVLDPGAAARLHVTRNQCWEPGRESDFERTLTITVRIPAGMALSINESGGADYALGALTGALALDISGGVKLHADATGPLTLNMSGGAEINIAQSTGSARAELSGGGSVRIDRAAWQALTLSVSGGSDFRVARGQIGRVTIDLSGAAVIDLGGVASDASVEMSGAGSVRFAKLTGHLTKAIDGVGTVTVDAP